MIFNPMWKMVVRLLRTVRQLLTVMLPEHSALRRLFKWAGGEVWCVSSVRANLMRGVEERDRPIISLLVNIRVLSFAFVTAPVLSLIPFVLLKAHVWGLLSFALGTVSIIFWLFVFRGLRSRVRPSKLIGIGAAATILLSVLLGGLLLSAQLFKSREELVGVYLALQLFTGIPFALIAGVDSKLSGSVYRAVEVRRRNGFSPSVEFRRCKVAGATAAAAFGALAWCFVILCHDKAIEVPQWYAVIFALNILPAALLLRYARLLDRRLRSHPLLGSQDGVATVESPAEEENHKTEVTESIVAIGCLDGLLQFSQFYFSIKAIRSLFASVPEHGLLLIAIPLLFYAVNGLEQLGSILFSRYNARPSRDETLKRRQLASLLTLVVAVSLFALSTVAVHVSGLDRLLPVVTYALFNVIKGFAGGLSEEWNEAIVRRHPQHDEARFTTLSALFGRLYQIAAFVCFLLLNGIANSSNWRNMTFTGQYDGNKERVMFVAALTACIFFIIALNFLAFLWINRDKPQQVSVWTVLRDAVVRREERTALFTQLLRLCFVVSLILANLLSLKVVPYKGLLFTHGSIFYITVFVLINLITVFEDVEAAIKTVFLGMFAYVLVYAALLLSAAAGGQLMLEAPLLTLETYNTLLGSIANLFAASFYAYVVTAVLSVGLLAAVSTYFGKRSAIYLGAGVTFICQAIDTVIYIRMGYGRTNVDLPSLIMGQFLMKFSVYLLMYFPLYCIIQGCMKWLGLERPPVKRLSPDKAIGESVKSFSKVRFFSR